MSAGGRRLATLAAALSSYALAITLAGNGFIAAFIAGIAFGASLPRDVADPDKVSELPELVGEILSLAVWFLFGAALVPVAFRYFSVWTLGYAVLSLTVIRLLPVWLALLGTRHDTQTVLFLGWFGPRGLASVVLAPGGRGTRTIRDRGQHRVRRGVHGAAERRRPRRLREAPSAVSTPGDTAKQPPSAAAPTRGA